MEEDRWGGGLSRDEMGTVRGSCGTGERESGEHREETVKDEERGGVHGGQVNMV